MPINNVCFIYLFTQFNYTLSYEDIENEKRSIRQYRLVRFIQKYRTFKVSLKINPTDIKI